MILGQGFAKGVWKRTNCAAQPGDRAAAAGVTSSAAMARKDFLKDLVRVRNCEEEDEMTISMTLPPAGRQRNMNRKKDEPIAKPLERIRRTVSSAYLQKAGKGQKKAQAKSEGGLANTEQVSCILLDQAGNPVPESTSNAEAWHSGYTLELKYVTSEEKPETKKLKIENNLPACLTLSLPRHVTAGDLVTAPSFTLEFCSAAECNWLWYVQEQDEWKLVREGGVELKVDQSFVGKRLKIECEPRSGGRIGEVKEAISEEPIEGAIDLEYMKARHRVMERTAVNQDRLRIMTYNILADVYSKTEYAKNVLYPDIAAKHLSTDFRQQLCLFEVDGFNNDIICMQEMDSIWFDNFWSKRLHSRGFSGFFGPKTSKVEGCALFWKTSKLSLIRQEYVHLFKLLANIEWLRKHLGEEVASTIENDKNLFNILKKITTVVQFALFETQDDSKKKFLVANTHLYFHPGASHIRSLSVAALLSYAAGFLSEANLGKETAVVVCGDLNSEPDTAAIELVANGSVSRDHYEWHDSSQFTWKGRDEESQGFEQDEELKYELRADGESDERYSRFELQNPFGKLASSDGLRSAFTNYVKGYIGSLDYIFYASEKMTLEKFAPLPLEKDLCRREDISAEGEINKQGYLPSQFFPSDHVSLVADFSFSEGKSICTWPPPEDRPVMPLPASRWNEGQAAEALRQGKIVALPTDTIYGVAASASSDVGIDRIYDAKQRPAHLPLALCISKASDIGRYGEVSHLPEGLVSEFLPGPYTLLLNRKSDSNISESLNPGTRTVGIRVPESSFIRGVVARLGFAIALTSANISGAQSSTAVGHFRSIWNKCEHVYDGGPLNAGTSGSTIIDLSQEGMYRIVRKGCSEEEAHTILQRFGLKDSSE